VDGDSRSRVPSCGRRYADAPTVALFTACGEANFLRPTRDNRPLVWTLAGLRFHMPFFPTTPSAAGAGIFQDMRRLQSLIGARH
jgi:hypothetical protein